MRRDELATQRPKCCEFRAMRRRFLSVCVSCAEWPLTTPHPTLNNVRYGASVASAPLPTHPCKRSCRWWTTPTAGCAGNVETIHPMPMCGTCAFIGTPSGFGVLGVRSTRGFNQIETKARPATPAWRPGTCISTGAVPSRAHERCGGSAGAHRRSLRLPVVQARCVFLLGHPAIASRRKRRLR